MRTSGSKCHAFISQSSPKRRAPYGRGRKKEKEKRTTKSGIHREDAILKIVLKHLEQPKACAVVLFVDFSSAFNTIRLHILLERMKTTRGNAFTIKWYHSFMTGISQLVRVNRTHSLSLTTNPGAPQGCVYSPLLYTLYTSDCKSTTSGSFTVKFADDSAVHSVLFAHNDIDTCFSEMN